MNPHDFIVWLSGVADSIGDAPPSQEQWDLIRDRTGEVVGKIVADKLLEHDQKDAYEKAKFVAEMELQYRKHELEKLKHFSKMAAHPAPVMKQEWTDNTTQSKI